MGFRDVVLFVGYGEQGNSLKTNPARVKEYIDSSCSVQVFDYLKNSWCTHFVYWVVDRAGMKGKIEKTPLGAKSVSRMFDAFPVTTNPRPGDLYYMKVVGGKTTHHIGFVSEVFENEIASLDGNSGSFKDPATNWSWKTSAGSGGGIGGGTVCKNRRKISEVTSFLELTPSDF
ncbi:MAG: CHAP domain-containing protein [Pyrinomonadaceae bacterium]